MNRIISIIILVAFTMYIVGCSKTVKISMEELRIKIEQQSESQDIKIKSVTLNNDSTVTFINNTGQVDFDSNMLYGILKTGDTSIIELDSVKYVSQRKFDVIKTSVFIGLYVATVVVLAITKPMEMDFGGKR